VSNNDTDHFTGTTESQEKKDESSEDCGNSQWCIYDVMWQFVSDMSSSNWRSSVWWMISDYNDDVEWRRPRASRTWGTCRWGTMVLSH